MHRPLFSLGRIYATAGVLKALNDDFSLIGELISDHVQGNWVALPKEDQISNFEAITKSGRVISKYYLESECIYAITEFDRSKTTVLLAKEYLPLSHV